MGTVRVVNMIPASMSGETNQDSEPNLAVNPERVRDMVGTAFTPAPMGTLAPIYISTNGGNTWELRSVVPGNGPAGTGDITVGFATRGGVLYAGILSGTTFLRMQILRTSSFTSTTAMTVLVQRDNVDQPWVVAGSVVAAGASTDRVYVGNNDFNQPGGRTATVDRSLDAATAAPPAGFAAFQLEQRATVGQDGPPIRIALHPDGTVFAAFHRWVPPPPPPPPPPQFVLPNLTFDIVVTRDDNWGSGTTPFNALVELAAPAGDGLVGQRVATNRFMRFNAQIGQERLVGDLSIAVDSTDSDNVWVAWCDRVGGVAGTDWTLHVRRSTDRGQNWSADVRTIANGKNPSLAVNTNGLLGLLYQELTGGQWVTRLELTANAWGSAAETHVLHQAPSATPVLTFFPYIGDYVRLLAVGADFYGVFSGNNTPDMANFPSGVTYQRSANWTTHTLLNTDGITPVAVSIDPFFFHWTERIIARGPIISPIIRRGPIIEPRGPIISRGPIIPEPIITPEPPSPIRPSEALSASPKPKRGPSKRKSTKPATKPKTAGRRRGSKSPKPPTDIEL